MRWLENFWTDLRNIKTLTGFSPFLNKRIGVYSVWLRVRAAKGLLLPLREDFLYLPFNKDGYVD